MMFELISRSVETRIVRSKWTLSLRSGVSAAALKAATQKIPDDARITDITEVDDDENGGVYMKYLFTIDAETE